MYRIVKMFNVGATDAEDVIGFQLSQGMGQCVSEEHENLRDTWCHQAGPWGMRPVTVSIHSPLMFMDWLDVFSTETNHGG